MSDASLQAAMTQALTAQLAPVALDLVDDSAAHAGHAGARSGAHSCSTAATASMEMRSERRAGSTWAWAGAEPGRSISLRRVDPTRSDRVEKLAHVGDGVELLTGETATSVSHFG